MSQRHVLIPAWIFEHPGDYYMVAIEPNGRVRVDGGHSDPQGVAKAAELHGAIDCIKAPAGTFWCMVKIESIPPFNGKVNQEAIRQLNSATPARRSAPNPDASGKVPGKEGGEKS